MDTIRKEIDNNRNNFYVLKNILISCAWDDMTNEYLEIIDIIKKRKDLNYIHILDILLKTLMANSTECVKILDEHLIDISLKYYITDDGKFERNDVIYNNPIGTSYCNAFSYNSVVPDHMEKCKKCSVVRIDKRIRFTDPKLIEYMSQKLKVPIDTFIPNIKYFDKDIVKYYIDKNELKNNFMKEMIKLKNDHISEDKKVDLLKQYFIKTDKNESVDVIKEIVCCNNQGLVTNIMKNIDINSYVCEYIISIAIKLNRNETFETVCKYFKSIPHKDDFLKKLICAMGNSIETLKQFRILTEHLNEFTDPSVYEFLMHKENNKKNPDMDFIVELTKYDHLIQDDSMEEIDLSNAVKTDDTNKNNYYIVIKKAGDPVKDTDIVDDIFSRIVTYNVDEKTLERLKKYAHNAKIPVKI